MAYLRKEKETVEMDFPLAQVWQAIQKTIKNLGWTTEKNDEPTHQIKAKTKSAFLSYSSIISIEATAIAKNTTRVKVTAETPVTTVTSIADFGRTQERIDSFLLVLSTQLNPENTRPEGEE
jgi:hypothetical protein